MSCCKDGACKCVDKKKEEEDFEIPESSLPVVDGRIYHLSINADELADKCIIVGDPERVPKITNKFFAKVTSDRFHRGLRTITGVTENGGVPMTVVTSGMGTPSLEIVLNELIAVHELDLATRKPRGGVRKPLTIIRVGTSGAVRSGTALGTAIIAKYAVGLDNTGTFYDAPCDAVTQGIEDAVTAAVRAAAAPGARFAARLAPYASAAAPEVIDELVAVAQAEKVLHKVGVTASAAGFFANQGRQIRPYLKVTVPNIDSVVGSVDLSGVAGLVPADIKIENLEMESAALYHIGAMAGCRCATVCCTVAQRRTGEFLANQAECVEAVSRLAVNTLVSLEKKGM